MADLSIGELAQRAGVTPSAIRYYEQAGLLPHPPRVSGRRCYGLNSLHRLRFIRLARDAGAGIGDIAAWLRAWDGGADAPLRDRISGELDRIDRRVASLQAVRLRLVQALECSCTSPADCPAVRQSQAEDAH